MMRVRRFFRQLVSLTALGGVLAGGSALLLGLRAPAPVRTRVAVADTALGDSAPDLSAYLGRSGQLRAIEYRADSTPALIAALVPFLAGRGPGLHATGLSAPDGGPIHALALLPLSAKRGAAWQGYRIGFWPGERAGRQARYPLPAGFLEVTPDNADVPLSTHFRVRDFLTKDQPAVWPKVLVIELPLLDKLELIALELETLGKPSSLRVMSGFRTPQYNARGVGAKGGRARDSQHMYGGAADIFVDADGDGRMDDLDGDGRVTVRDAGWLAGVAERVEAAHPGVVGGIGIYRATAAHGPFVHVDVRGTAARW
ncbi:MAG: DUF882 domain-containing protein [Gemmatimonadetes bacterium]|nr:DUF882 domain-containing protein [Gemmatimonadota bacterium]